MISKCTSFYERRESLSVTTSLFVKVTCNEQSLEITSFRTTGSMAHDRPSYMKCHSTMLFVVFLSLSSKCLENPAPHNQSSKFYFERKTKPGITKWFITMMALIKNCSRDTQFRGRGRHLRNRSNKKQSQQKKLLTISFFCKNDAMWLTTRGTAESVTTLLFSL